MYTIVGHDVTGQPIAVATHLHAQPPPPPARIDGKLRERSGTDLEPYNSAFWRSLALPWGGMLTTAAGALALVQAFAGLPDGFLAPALRAEATRDQSGGLAGDM